MVAIMFFYASKCNGICNWHKAGTAILTYLIKWQVAFVDNVKTLTSGKLPCQHKYYDSIWPTAAICDACIWW